MPRVALLVPLLLLVGCGSSQRRFDYRVPSRAMEPTYRVGKVLKIDPHAYQSSVPQLGDVVIFHPSREGIALPAKGPGSACGGGYGSGKPCPLSAPDKSSELVIKRVVAGPGDTIAIRRGHVIRNGVLQKEPFIAPCDGSVECDFPAAITVPKGTFYMLGDNRGVSLDSRFFGPIPRGWIVGKVVG